MVAPTAPLTGSPPAIQDAARLRVAVAPSGELLVDTAAADADAEETGDGLTPAARARVTAAFKRGPGHGLLDLSLRLPLSDSSADQFPLADRS